MAKFFVSTTAAGSYSPALGPAKKRRDRNRAAWQAPRQAANTTPDRGVNHLVVEEKEKDRRRKPAKPKAAETEARPSGRKRPAAPEVGLALRSVYQRTIDEDIPPEMLDLLGKLG